MRPLRFVLLVACFLAIPVLLTCFSLLRGQTDGANVFGHPQRGRLRALFSFSTPSALFPPSAIISLTFENSTFFLARPAAFGPSLPSRGLSGQLWIGKGFGDDALLSEDELKSSGFELGCSDVPGWGDDQRNTPDNPALHERTFKKSHEDTTQSTHLESWIANDLNQADSLAADGTPMPNDQDGTDDHLHRPLQDSNPAVAGKTGESANISPIDKSQKKPNHADIESLQESADIHGKIVMLSRGGCGFLEKVKWTQRRGGIALIVGDNERNGQLTIMYAKGDTSNVTIPAIFTSYTSAHLLSSLVPPESEITASQEGTKAGLSNTKETIDSSKGKVYGVNKNDGPVFTTTAISISTSSRGQAKSKSTSNPDKVAPAHEHHGWMQNVLQAVGIDDPSAHGEDSRRPPGSGNIEWVQVKEWDDDPKTTNTGTRTLAAPSRSSSTTKQKTTTGVGNDDFVIGVQDWRDTELIAPKSTSTSTKLDTKAKNDKPKVQATNTVTGLDTKETALKGGSIIPGSGEYADLNKDDKDPKGVDYKKDEGEVHEDCGSKLKKIKSWFGKSSAPPFPSESNNSFWHPRKPKKDQREGLWVTLTPTSVSTSPFFDTLLVLVVSPLVTLTFVYGLLLLRSRIRRRRWRAPKSVVDRLPVRTYHTMSSASSTTSSQSQPRDRSPVASPQSRPESVRSRQRSQTIIGVVSSPNSSSEAPSPEKSKTKAKPKRYRGRQVECVVCLEEYVDGESKVMSLPCGHEFHADCITPWLVNRRRTCPICKGDVVRSLARAASDDSAVEQDNTEPGEETSDDIQERAATTVPDNASAAAIPIPDRQETPNIMDEDIERGEEAPLEQDAQRPIASRWRGIINASLSNLSGDTVWRTNSVDRNR